jgi:small multidrug resistance family-3 protein
VYAAYGGVFVIMSLLWGWLLDGHRPDRFDWAGAAIVAAGVAVIFFSPRGA